VSETGVCLELFLSWLNQAHERGFRLQGAEGPSVLASDEQTRLVIEVRSLHDPPLDAAWLAARERLQERLSATLPGGSYAFWVPAGADLPGEGSESDAFVEHVRRAALKLGPRERSQVALPIPLYLRKTSESGGVVSVAGGLNAYWARFTEFVRGTYDLDSRRLHRLPEREGHLQELIDRIIERAKELAPGQATEIETVDSWTIQRLLGEPGFTIIGAPPQETADMGLAVRRNFRRMLAEAGKRLAGEDAALRALLAVGYYPRIEQEGATTAMRGYDPATYSGIDFVCLVADGLVKPLILPPAGLLPWNRPASP